MSSSSSVNLDSESIQRQMEALQEQINQINSERAAEKRERVDSLDLLDIQALYEKKQALELLQERYRADLAERNAARAVEAQVDPINQIGTPAKLSGKAALVISNSLVKEAAEKTAEKAAKVALEKSAQALAGEAAEIGLKEGAKMASKKGSAKMAEQVARYVPYVGLVLGTGLAIKRYNDGDSYYKVGAEFASGVMTCFPGFVVASIAVDVALLVTDVWGQVHGAPEAILAQEVPQIDIQTLYDIIGIELAQGLEPTKDEVDRCYRRLSLKIHGDRLAELGPELQAKYGELMAFLNSVRDAIYTQRQWAAENN